MNVSDWLWKYYEWFIDDSRKTRDFYVLAALLCEQFCRFANEGAKISTKSYVIRSFFSQCIQQQWSVSQNCFHSEAGDCSLLVSEKKRGNCDQTTCFMSKVTSVPQKPRTNHSQCSSPVEALNLIVESKSQPLELSWVVLWTLTSLI